jgi:hypothetical protein
MAASKAIKGKGTKLGYAATAIAAPTNIAEIIDIDGPEKEIKSIDVSNMDSPDDIDESIPGNASLKDVSFDINFEEDQEDLLETQFGVQQFWTIELPNGAKRTFPGYLKKIGAKIPMGGVIRTSVAVAVTGKTTFTKAPAA